MNISRGDNLKGIFEGRLGHSALCVTSGVAAIRFMRMDASAAAVLTLSVMSLWTLAILLRNRSLSGYSGGFSLLMIGYLAAACSLSTPHGTGLSSIAGRPCRIEGEVVGLPSGFAGGQSVRLLCRRAQVGGRIIHAGEFVRLWIYGAGEELIDPGDLIRAEVTLKRPRGKRFPGDRNRRLSLAGERVYLTGYVDAGPRLLVRKGSVPLEWKPAVFFGKATSRLLRSLEQPADGLLHALLLGRKHRLDEDIIKSFQSLGLSHILAVSGLHVGLVGLLFYSAALFSLRMPRCLAERLDVRRIAALLSMAPVIFYTMVTGGRPPAARACIMAVVYLAGIVQDRSSNSMDALFLAVIIILVHSPPALFSPSFQLSFLAVLAIIRAVGSFPRLFCDQNRSRRWNALLWVPRYLVISTAAFLGTVPLSAFHFSIVAPAGPFASMLAVPLCALVILPFGLAGGVVSLVSPAAARIVVFPAARGCLILSELAQTAAAGRHLHLDGFHPSPAQVIAVYLLLISVVTGRRNTGRKMAMPGILLLVSCTLIMGRLAGSSDLRCTFLDVGNGDAALIELAGGGNILVDAGGRFGAVDRGKTVILPFLRARRINRLDAVVISHSHNDHSGGVLSVLEEIPTGEVFHPKWISGRGHELEASLAGYSHRVMGEGDMVRYRAAELIFMNPAGNGHDRPRSANEDRINDNSIVFICRGPGGDIIFPGDAGRAVLAALSKKYGSLMAAQVLKVPHHGSRHSWSENFNGQVGALAAVVTAGSNPFGHPDPMVMKEMRRCGTELYITGRDGSVECTLSGGRVRTVCWPGDDDRLSPYGVWHWFMLGY